MNITLVVVSKTDMAFVQQGLDIYLERLKHYCNFTLEVISAPKDRRNMKPDEVKQREGELILKRLAKADCVAASASIRDTEFYDEASDLSRCV